MRVSADMPDDVHVLHDALQQLKTHKKGEPLTLHLKNCGTALRFLQVHLVHCYPDEPITLTGDARLMERDGAPTSQTTSALILHGEDVPVATDESPYITMTRSMTRSYSLHRPVVLERDWTAASYWYEYIAIYGGELLLEGLASDSLQGDRVLADIYAEHFGVTTAFVAEGAIITSVRQTDCAARQTVNVPACQKKPVTIDFSACPDLYPAVALTCEKLEMALHATGTKRLRYKECDRLEAVRLHQTRHDHRMAMALMVAGFPVDDTTCIGKSYPSFLRQFSDLDVPPFIPGRHQAIR